MIVDSVLEISRPKIHTVIIIIIIIMRIRFVQKFIQKDSYKYNR